MQDRYVGDIGDFGKYGLLKFIVEKTRLKLGINWYLVNPQELNEQSRNDGKKTKYLYSNDEKYTSCDSTLYKQLKPIVDDNKRSVEEVESRSILPKGTIFYKEKLSFENIIGKEARITHRREWVKNGLKATSECEIVYFDPDNGFQIASCPRHYKEGIKYVFYDEIVEYYKRNQSLIIYQHRDMMTPDEESLKKFEILSNYFPDLKMICGLRWHRESSRDYVFILTEKHREMVQSVIKNDIKKSPWSKHFTYWEIEIGRNK